MRAGSTACGVVNNYSSQTRCDFYRFYETIIIHSLNECNWHLAL